MHQQSDARGQKQDDAAHEGRTRLSAGASITGDLSVPGTAEILGEVEGKVTARTIAIEETGSVRGELDAPGIIIRGRFDGTLTGDDVTVHAGATVSGDITYKSLAIETGAEVTARITRKQDNFDRAVAVTPGDQTESNAGARG